MYKTKTINATHEITVQSTNYITTSFYTTIITYTTIIFRIKRDMSDKRYPKVNLTFLFIYFYKLFLIFVSSSQSYLLTKCPKTVKLKKVSFSSKIIKLNTFYCFEFHLF